MTGRERGGQVAADRLAAVVAGGGIAGLASAIALAQAGWPVTVLERAREFGEVGAGLAITANGRTALAALGLDAAIMIGRLGADLGGGWRQTARNTLLRLTPPGPFTKAGRSIVDWTAP